MKKLTAFLLILALALSLSCAAYADGDKLPAPEPDESSMFGVDKNINMATLDNYLGREDVVYRDVRMLFDPADYAAIGGNADLASTVDIFLYLTKCAEPLKIVGPDTPKCVKSISPKSL